MKGGHEGAVLIAAYSRLFKIDDRITQLIIERCENANEFIRLEDTLKINSDIKNLKCIVRLTLMNREYGDLSGLNENDIEYIEKEYGIKIGKVSRRENLSAFDVLKIFEEIRKIPNNQRITEILSKDRVNLVGSTRIEKKHKPTNLKTAHFIKQINYEKGIVCFINDRYNYKEAIRKIIEEIHGTYKIINPLCYNWRHYNSKTICSRNLTVQSTRKK